MQQTFQAKQQAAAAWLHGRHMSETPNRRSRRHHSHVLRVHQREAGKHIA